MARMNGTCGAPCREGRPTRRGAAILNTQRMSVALHLAAAWEIAVELKVPGVEDEAALFDAAALGA